MIINNNHNKLFYERIWKLTGRVQQMQIGGGAVVDVVELNNKTLYASPYLVYNEQGYSKHYYAGAERVSSRIGGGMANALVDPLNSALPHLSKYDDYTAIAADIKEMMMRSIACTDMPGQYVSMEFRLNTIEERMGRLNPEENRYIYHSDHASTSLSTSLGSSAFLTDALGTPTQHLQYLPFGENFIEQRSITDYYTPYTFSAKERDMETGYSYFGARYYDANVSVWLSVDPMADQRGWVSPYSYCQNSPIIRIDPTGALDWIPPTDDSGNWTAEPGDGYWKLSQQAGIPLEDAKNAVITANQNRGQARTSETMVYPGDVVNVGTPQTEASTASTTTNYQMSYPASGACESVSVVETLIDVFIREPIQDALEYLGMSENAAFWTSTGVTIAGSVVLASRFSRMPSTAAKGVAAPKGWITQASKKGGGTVFKDPKNPYNIIRQMPGNPKSPNPAQRNPYVKFMKDGKFYDVNGNPLPNGNVPAAHIPLTQFNINNMPKF